MRVGPGRRFTIPLLFVLLAAALYALSRHPFGFDARADRGGIVNAHEHFQSIQGVPKFLEAMKENGVTQTLIVGSPEATILKGREGFFGEEEFNEAVLEIGRVYPDQFIVFPTVNVKDPAKLEKLKRYLERGGRGLKLYSGHTFFHDAPLDEASMHPVYQYCEEERVPILFHVNPGHYREEFENVLKRYPRLKVICPHYCLSTVNTQRLEELMDRYPRLFIDISFGYMDFLIQGLKRFSRNPARYRRLVEKYQDRIFFGTDMVVTNAPHKTVEWLTKVTRVYRDLLEREHFEFFAIEGMTLRGLHLDPKILKKIYRTNFENFLRS